MILVSKWALWCRPGLHTAGKRMSKAEWMALNDHRWFSKINRELVSHLLRQLRHLLRQPELCHEIRLSIQTPGSQSGSRGESYPFATTSFQAWLITALLDGPVLWTWEQLNSEKSSTCESPGICLKFISDLTLSIVTKDAFGELPELWNISIHVDNTSHRGAKGLAHISASVEESEDVVHLLKKSYFLSTQTQCFVARKIPSFFSPFPSPPFPFFPSQLFALQHGGLECYLKYDCMGVLSTYWVQS